MEQKDTTILIPIYNQNNYKYHLCYNCNKKIYIKEDIWKPMYFKEKINYCPYCGSNIIRYAKPIFEEEPNFEWIEKFKKIFDSTEKLIKYELFCKMSEEERKEIIEKARFGIEYFGDGICWNCNTNMCHIVKEIAQQKLHYTEIRKIKEFVERE